MALVVLITRSLLIALILLSLAFLLCLLLFLLYIICVFLVLMGVTFLNAGLLRMVLLPVLIWLTLFSIVTIGSGLVDPLGNQVMFVLIASGLMFLLAFAMKRATIAIALKLGLILNLYSAVTLITVIPGQTAVPLIWLLVLLLNMTFWTILSLHLLLVLLPRQYLKLSPAKASIFRLEQIRPLVLVTLAPLIRAPVPLPKLPPPITPTAATR